MGEKTVPVEWVEEIIQSFNMLNFAPSMYDVIKATLHKLEIKVKGEN